MKFFSFLFFVLISRTLSAQCPADTAYPFTVDSVHLKIWNQTEYVPFFVKGCNLGVTLPGKYPGQLEVSRDQYAEWLQLIRDAGFNCVRLYTRHFPAFYEVLDSMNKANPKNPLFFFQGVWLEEDVAGYGSDLNELNASFTNEIFENIDCIHGNRTIGQVPGKSFGNYSTDASRWNMGYIIAREIAPGEILHTNQSHPADTVFTGSHFSITGNPSEIFLTRHLNELVSYEDSLYHTQRPVSVCNWPTLDPLKHPLEKSRWEDSVSVDLNKIDFHNAPAGYFASFHAYPYYPDFISNDPDYQSYSDAYGQDSYLGYLNALKNHYNRVPLIIAECGVPSSWAAAHYSESGMNHGGYDEQEQGSTMMRIINNVNEANGAGAINFEFMDEWFKRTWITDPLDYDIDRRVLWHNVMAAEQNFGMIGFHSTPQMQTWATYNSPNPIRKIKAGADHEFFHLILNLGSAISVDDEFWISLDTYRSDMGESVLPNGDNVNNRAEFVLHIRNYSAELYVTQAYDNYKIWSGNADTTIKYRSTPTNGAPWKIERWENNNILHQIQYVGDLKVNQSYLPPSTKDAVTFYHDSLQIRIPWTLLNVIDPSKMTVLNDDRSVPGTQDTTSDGFAISVRYKNQFAVPGTRFIWAGWNTINNVTEYTKASYSVIKNELPNINNPAIAVGDKYPQVDSFPFVKSASDGVMKNDFDLDGKSFEALLIGNAHHGFVNLNQDGSFEYQADLGFTGTDYFEYCLFDGHSLSSTTRVCLDVNNPVPADTISIDTTIIDSTTTVGTDTIPNDSTTTTVTDSTTTTVSDSTVTSDSTIVIGTDTTVTDSTVTTINDSNVTVINDTTSAIDTTTSTVTDSLILATTHLAWEKIILYPNPCSAVLNISSKEIIKSITIFDSGGKLIIELHHPDPGKVDTWYLPNGNYFLKLDFANRSKLERFSVMH
jgi:hypothetical protein